MINKGLKSKNGFTLVELIVTLAILGIFLAVGGTMYFQGNRMFTTTAVKNTEKSLGDNMYSFMRDKLVYATKLEIIDPENPNQKPQYSNVFKIEEERLNYNEKDIYGEAYYNGYTVSYDIEVQKNSKNQFNLTVYVKKNNEIVYQTGAAIKNINLIPNKSYIEVAQDSKKKSDQPYNNPVVSFIEKNETGIVYAPIELRQYMVDTNQQMIDYNKSNPKDESLLPDKWKEYMNNTGWYTNDRIREYVLKRFYRKENDATGLVNYWPDFPGLDEKVVERIDLEIKDKTGNNIRLLSDFIKTDNLVLMGYMYKGISKKNTEGVSISVPGDDSCFVYVAQRPNNLNSGWSADLVFDFEEGCWYYFFKTGNPNSIKQISDLPWHIDSECPGKNMTFREFYKENKINIEKGVSEKIHDEDNWIKIVT